MNVTRTERHAPPRSREQREADYVTVARLYCEGKTLREIAKVIGVVASQALGDLRVVRARWRADANLKMEEATARELAKIDNLEREYWDAWSRSRENAETNSQEIVDVPIIQKGVAIPAQRRLVRKQTENRDGNPRFLEGIQWCIDRRIKLLGLDAPVKVDITDRIRERAIAAGLDPDRAVAAAERILRERAAAQATA